MWTKEEKKKEKRTKNLLRGLGSAERQEAKKHLPLLLFLRQQLEHITISVVYSIYIIDTYGSSLTSTMVNWMWKLLLWTRWVWTAHGGDCSAQSSSKGGTVPSDIMLSKRVVLSDYLLLATLRYCKCHGLNSTPLLRFGSKPHSA